MASLAPFRFSWTQDRGNGKNPVPASPCPQLQSIALVAAGRNVARKARHKKIARWTLPLWFYVSVTGVIVYWMLYHLHAQVTAR